MQFWALGCMILFVFLQESTSQDPVRSLHIMTEIHSRFAVTNVGSILENPDRWRAMNTTFEYTIPDEAFITNFTMEMDGRLVMGTVKERELAMLEYEDAVDRGHSAAHISQNPRDTNVFTISVNVKAGGQVIFILTYQEVLRRFDGAFRHYLYIPSQQEVEELQVDVLISERTALKFVHVPQIQRGLSQKPNSELMNSIESSDVRVRSHSENDGSLAYVAYSPNVDGVGRRGGDMVVLYDVEHDFNGGQIETVDGFFVHFFSPEEEGFQGDKHVVFVLDKSGSMRNNKIRQLKEALRQILSEMDDTDRFNMVWFSNSATLWKRESVYATRNNVAEAMNHIESQHAGGGTNIYESLNMALDTLQNDRANPRPLASMVFFLTDGLPTVGITDGYRITQDVSSKNQRDRFNIHSIAFGDKADYAMLKDLSSNNFGIARKIYVDSDAAVQLEGFYREVGFPLLTDMNIRYIEGNVDVNSIVQPDETNNFVQGNEIVRTGKMQSDSVKAFVTGKSKRGRERLQADSFKTEPKCFPPLWPDINMKMIRQGTKWLCPPNQWPQGLQFNPVSDNSRLSKINFPPSTIGGFVEHLWAYLTVKKKIDESKYLARDRNHEEQLKSQAIDLALRYNFVTELTSMVVVPPNDRIERELEDVPRVSRQQQLTAPAGPGQRLCFIDVILVLDEKQPSAVDNAKRFMDRLSDNPMVMARYAVVVKYQSQTAAPTRVARPSWIRNSALWARWNRFNQRNQQPASDYRVIHDFMDVQTPEAVLKKIDTLNSYTKGPKYNVLLDKSGQQFGANNFHKALVLFSADSSASSSLNAALKPSKLATVTRGARVPAAVASVQNLCNSARSG